ncbi:hypothetical protein KUCAC02_015466 [Chaenocephalus aceratus]|uniref:Uncharacterized protein n=1 Tax=Chaenocephalus aceratus TaxID=36190 RepID=A0ACB9XXL1_CHAAC|nr:hypothetical protein KUCAC02_015466 [Chaenocephalus aceratus]
MDKVTIGDEVTRQELLPEPLLIILSPPPPFLPGAGKPTMFWHKWLKAFEHYFHALGEHELAESSKCGLLRNCLGFEGQHIFTALIQSETSYTAVISSLTLYFCSDHTSQMCRLKFHQRAQMPGEGVDVFVSALEELLRPCNYGHLQDKLILDQLIEKTNCPPLKERLLLERETLTLDKALAIGKEVESAFNETDLFSIHEVSVDIEDDLGPPVPTKRKRGRPRRGEGKLKIETKPPSIKTHTRSSRRKDSYYYSNDKQYYSENDGGVSESAHETNLALDEPNDEAAKEENAHETDLALDEPNDEAAKEENAHETNLALDEPNDEAAKEENAHETNLALDEPNDEAAKKVKRALSSSSLDWMEEEGCNYASDGVDDEDVEVDEEIDEDEEVDEDVDEEVDVDEDFKPKQKGPYCPICITTRFRDINKLSRHMRMHTKEKPFSCPVCSTTFSQSYHMTRHMRNQHNAGQHVCSTCGESYKSLADLQSHKKMHLSCPSCQKEFTNNKALCSHVLSHSEDQSTQVEGQSQLEGQSPLQSDEIKNQEIKSINKDNDESIDINDNVAENSADSDNSDSQDEECED